MDDAMKLKAIVLGTIAILLLVGFSGCIETEPEEDIVIKNQNVSGTSSLMRTSAGQIFNSGDMDYIDIIKIQAWEPSANATIYFKLYDSSGRNIFTKTYSSNYWLGQWMTFGIAETINKNTIYTFTVTSYSGTIHFRATLYDSYDGGACVGYGNWDLMFEVIGHT